MSEVSEPSGASCTFGGEKINVGLDDGTPSGIAGDGVLETGEIDCSSYICNVPKKVFLTRTTSTGVLGADGGLDNAHAFCRARAAASPLALTGQYKAWLGDANYGPADFFSPGVGYVLVDGTTVVATSWKDLTDGTLQHAISKDEPRNPASGIVWTNVNTDGSITSFSAGYCSDWYDGTNANTGYTGNSANTDSTWTATGTAASCNDTYHLYCFEQ